MRNTALTGALLGTLALANGMNTASASDAKTGATQLDEIEITAEPWDPPKPKIRFRPAYPMTAMHRWEEGCVVLRYTIRPDGKTDDFAIMESNPRGVFEKTVVAAVFKWNFEPSEESRTLVEKFEFRNPRLSTSPVQSVVSYNVPIEPRPFGTSTQPMITTEGYKIPRCKEWDRTHDRDDHGPELVSESEQVSSARGGAQAPAKRSYR